VNLPILDIRQVPQSLPSKIEATIDPFLNFLTDKLEPNVWLFIVDGKDDLSALTQFVALKLAKYNCMMFNYVPCKAKMLNNITS